MGAAAALIAAPHLSNVAFIVAGVPFANLDHLTRYTLKANHYSPVWLPFIKVALLTELGANYFSPMPDQTIRQIHAPLLLIGADRDETVPPTDAAYLYQKANQPKTLWQSPNGHFLYTDDPKALLTHILPVITGQ